MELGGGEGMGVGVGASLGTTPRGGSTSWCGVVSESSSTACCAPWTPGVLVASGRRARCVTKIHTDPATTRSEIRHKAEMTSRWYHMLRR